MSVPSTLGKVRSRVGSAASSWAGARPNGLVQSCWEKNPASPVSCSNGPLRRAAALAATTGGSDRPLVPASARLRQQKATTVARGYDGGGQNSCTMLIPLSIQLPVSASQTWLEESSPRSWPPMLMARTSTR